jgi:hypothetical protein
MKKLILILAILPVLVGCGPSQHTRLTAKEMHDKMEECKRYDLVPFTVLDAWNLEIVDIGCTLPQNK